MTTPSQKVDLWDRLKFTWSNFKKLRHPIAELHYGIRHNTIPWGKCSIYTLIAGVFLDCRWDVWTFKHLHLGWLYPYNPYFYWVYFFIVLTAGYWTWAWYQVSLKGQLSDQLVEIFTNSGLKNRIGRVPQFVSNEALDSQSSKLKVTMASLPKSDFEKAKPSLEAGLQVYIDEIKEIRDRGLIEINYSYAPMPSIVKIDDIKSFPKFKFLVGNTRTSRITSNLMDTPHILVAGPTKKGKSTFLRQLITTFYLNNSTARFLLIDLKGGLEFQLFEHLPRVNVIPNIRDATNELAKLDKVLEERMAFLKTHECKDIDAYFALPDEKRKKIDAENKTNFDRFIIVIDEAAEIFLAGNHAEGKEIQVAKRVLSKCARQGRAVGINLIIATQRPDSKSLDSQVRSNLVTALALPMVNDASSIAVLGNGRATDLPPYPGRAIWKDISEMAEVQTPLLTEEETRKLLEPYRIEKNQKQASQPLRSLVRTEQKVEVTEKSSDDKNTETDQAIDAHSVVFGELASKDEVSPQGAS